MVSCGHRRDAARVGYLGALWVVGVVLAVPALVWWVHDTAGISHADWFWMGLDRRRWQYGVWLGWVAGGWISIVIISAWSRSDERHDLLAEVHARHRRHGEV